MKENKKNLMDETTRKEVAAKFYKDMQGTMVDLAVRWQDEKEYEDINDYAKPIKPKVEAIGGEFIKMMKSPSFGFTFKLGIATYRINHGKTIYSYKRIA